MRTGSETAPSRIAERIAPRLARRTTTMRTVDAWRAVQRIRARLRLPYSAKRKQPTMRKRRRINLGAKVRFDLR
jgi:hypothetical protein